MNYYSSVRAYLVRSSEGRRKAYFPVWPFRQAFRMANYDTGNRRTAGQVDRITGNPTGSTSARSPGTGLTVWPSGSAAATPKPPVPALSVWPDRYTDRRTGSPAAAPERQETTPEPPELYLTTLIEKRYWDDRPRPRQRVRRPRPTQRHYFFFQVVSFRFRQRNRPFLRLSGRHRAKRRHETHGTPNKRPLQGYSSGPLPYRTYCSPGQHVRNGRFRPFLALQTVRPPFPVQTARPPETALSGLIWTQKKTAGFLRACPHTNRPLTKEGIPTTPLRKV